MIGLSAFLIKDIRWFLIAWMWSFISFSNLSINQSSMELQLSLSLSLWYLGSMASISSSCRIFARNSHSYKKRLKELFSEKDTFYALGLWVVVLFGGIPVIFALQRGQSFTFQFPKLNIFRSEEYYYKKILPFSDSHHVQLWHTLHSKQNFSLLICS